MASSKEYIEFVLEQCNGLSARAMMGEYVLYYGGKAVGGIYDNRLLVKPTPSVVALMPEAQCDSHTKVQKKCSLWKMLRIEIS